jgi:hypothetical protein
VPSSLSPLVNLPSHLDASASLSALRVVGILGLCGSQEDTAHLDFIGEPLVTLLGFMTLPLVLMCKGNLGDVREES